ncbi:hypothetical protein [Ferruginibacter sp.]
MKRETYADLLFIGIIFIAILFLPVSKNSLKVKAAAFDKIIQGIKTINTDDTALFNKAGLLSFLLFKF